MVRAAALVVASKRVKGGAALNHQPCHTVEHDAFTKSHAIGRRASCLAAALVVASKRVKGGAALIRSSTEVPR